MAVILAPPTTAQTPVKADTAFKALILNGVAAVESAPLTIEIRAVDKSLGKEIATFSWFDANLQFAGLKNLDGSTFQVHGRIANAKKGRHSQAKIVDGRLQLVDVVLSGPLILAYEGREETLIGRSIWSWSAVVPPLVAILLAIITRQVLVSLFMGVLVGVCFVTGSLGEGFAETVATYIPDSVGSGNVRIIIFSCLLGSVVALVARMGGTQALVDLMTRFGKSRRGAQIATWCAGMFVFFDDYANALLVGNTMRPVTDRYRVSREKLSFLVDATSAPVACIFIVSTWIAAEIGYIEEKLASPAVQAATGLTNSMGYQVFLSTIPFNFYPIFCLAFVLFLCLLGRDFGPMLKAEKRALKEGKLLADGASPLSSQEMDDLEPVDRSRMRALNAVLPIGTVIVGVILGLYFSGKSALALNDVVNPPLRDIFGAADSSRALMIASVSGILVAMGLALGQRLMSLRQTVEVATAGIKAMIPAALVLILAWSLQGVCSALNTSQFLIHHVSFSIEYLPLAIFVLAAVIGFSTGTSWGTMGILVPLCIDYACGMGLEAGYDSAGIQQVLASSVGAVLAGAVFGDHCSPISDTTIMSSMASGADHVDHVRTQMPYALVIALVAVGVGYLPAGFGVSPMILLPLGLTSCFLIVRYFGKPVESN